MRWSPPESDGGCPITSYHIYIYDTAWLEIDALLVSNKPLLTQYDINMAAYTPGSRLTVKMGVENSIGLVQSDSVAFLLASVPS